MSIIPFIIMFVIFYFLLIRPQQKKAKEHADMITNLKKGDTVITGGGIYGKITSVDESTAMVEIADKIKIKITKSTIAGLVSAPHSKAQLEPK
ncbi:MAG: preprotein translocase subunit YajC [Desulfobacterales bacterium]|nr:preprotein translocase subunit YajC [Desulfobacterales bacterium]